MAKDYNISKTSGLCVSCQDELPVGDEFVATVREAGEEFRREDYCLQCWQRHQQTQGGDRPELFGVWRSKVAKLQEKKKLFIDDDLLINFFERIGEATDEMKSSFRYVLALVLMRKKLLVYDRTQRDDDEAEVWLMHFKGSDETHRVIDPKMNEEKIAEVSRQLGQILEGEL